ncbi:hypothetical protein BDV96DRAFT_152259 [Lophiotrema nucula]|uniref:Zn(2)-C6 fungal-type domain-containing protein n=1 Tax=Lophiotrema nucula TaxID=690887 RepID=A0A6A5YZK2_9PLEO|nr:hypothetical protein BDV96DRAFT_152259 [Lophiotrema nucula]
MATLDDELDFKYHRGLQPDVYYRCPTSDSLDGALRNEIERSAQSLIPVEICTEFVFGAGSTITLLPTQQPNLDGLGIQPSGLPQLTTVNHALCDGIEGKDRLKIQRAVARCFIETIQAIDRFKYAERQALNKDGTDGVRFKYVCSDSLQNRDRKNNVKKKQEDLENGDGKRKRYRPSQALPTYDCGGAIHIKFSLKREAINVVYKHNPIHRDVESRNANEENGSLLALQDTSMEQNDNTVETPKRKRKRSKKTQVEPYQQDDNHDEDYIHADLDISPEPEPDRARSSGKKKRKKSSASASPEAFRGSKKQQKSKQPQSPSKSRKKTVLEPSPPPKPVKGKACVRCREKKIKCNEAKPTCNQCRRGLWTCQYQDAPVKKRSRNGCINCRQRKRKCTEERPSCVYCLKVDDDCGYADDYA